MFEPLVSSPVSRFHPFPPLVYLDYRLRSPSGVLSLLTQAKNLRRSLTTNTFLRPSDALSKGKKTPNPTTTTIICRLRPSQPSLSCLRKRCVHLLFDLPFKKKKPKIIISTLLFFFFFFSLFFCFLSPCFFVGLLFFHYPRFFPLLFIFFFFTDLSITFDQLLRHRPQSDPFSFGAPRLIDKKHPCVAHRLSKLSTITNQGPVTRRNWRSARETSFTSSAGRTTWIGTKRAIPSSLVLGGWCLCRFLRLLARTKETVLGQGTFIRRRNPTTPVSQIEPQLLSQAPISSTVHQNSALPPRFPECRRSARAARVPWSTVSSSMTSRRSDPMS
jgi:hypothetical protein